MKFLRKVDYTGVGGVDVWDEHWQKQHINTRLNQVEKDPVTPIIRKWIEDTTVDKEHIKILDGGCGAGRHLVYFGKLGYEIIGVDFSPVAVKSARDFDPNLKIFEASVLELPFDSETFDYYLSLGVLEHFIDGPEQGLKEAHRILKKGGMLFLSVPYMNRLRMLYKHLGNLRYKSHKKEAGVGGQFYQYYFTEDELSWLLTSHDFQVLRDYPLNQELGLLRAVPFVRNKRVLGYIAIKLAGAFRFIAPHFCAHKIMLVCKKVT
ncbi:class I SAM-dependent methyltransferase [Chloroflexota bacterium]